MLLAVDGRIVVSLKPPGFYKKCGDYVSEDESEVSIVGEFYTVISQLTAFTRI